MCRAIVLLSMTVSSLGLVLQADSQAAELVVSTTSELSAALGSAQPGDQILLAPGTYAGGLFRANLSGVTIRSQDPNNRAIISGGQVNLRLSDATDVTIEQLIFENAGGHAINIDDGSSFETPTSNLTIRDIEIRNPGLSAIKLSGVTGFLIDRLRAIEWGNSGGGVAMVGAHNGLIQNSFFRDIKGDGTTAAGAMYAKGGSKNITFRANRVVLNRNGSRRAIVSGGQTGAQYFRFIEGDSGYEAKNTVVEGNVVLGGAASLSSINTDNDVFHHNYIERPGNWVLRILNENINTGNPVVDTQSGQILDNVIIYRDNSTEYITDVNIGPQTLPETFVFARNQWFNQTDPTVNGSKPTLPSTEIDGIYGVDPQINRNGPIAWTFSWGTWIVNASEQAGTFTPENPDDFRIATPGADATFTTRDAAPLQGEWTYSEIGTGNLVLEPFSQVILVSCELDGVCSSGDFDADGDVDGADFLTWQRGFGTPSGATAGNGDADADGDVDADDLLVWEQQLGDIASLSSSQAVPEPSSLYLVVTLSVLVGRPVLFLVGARQQQE